MRFTGSSTAALASAVKQTRVTNFTNSDCDITYDRFARTSEVPLRRRERLGTRATAALTCDQQPFVVAPLSDLEFLVFICTTMEC